MKYLVKFQNRLIERKFYLDTDLKVKYFDNVLSENNSLDQTVTEKQFSTQEEVLVRGEKYLVIETRTDRYHDELDKGKFDALQTVTLDRATVIYLNQKEDVLNDHFLPAFAELLNENKATIKQDGRTQIHIENSDNNRIEVSGKRITEETDDKIGILSPTYSHDTVDFEHLGMVSTEGISTLHKGEKVIPLEEWNKARKNLEENYKEMLVDTKKDKPSMFKKFMNWIKE